jgi:hypothetical protein
MIGLVGFVVRVDRSRGVSDQFPKPSRDGRKMFWQSGKSATTSEFHANLAVRRFSSTQAGFTESPVASTAVLSCNSTGVD